MSDDDSLSSAALSVYAFLARGDAALPAVAAGTGLSAETARQALAALERQQLVRPLPTALEQYAAVSPAQALGRRLEELRVGHARQAARLHEVEAEFEALQQIATAATAPAIWCDVGADDLATTSTSLMDEARVEVRVFLASKPSPLRLGALVVQAAQLADRGLSVRVICLDSVGRALLAPVAAAAQHLPDAVHVRTAPVLPLSLLVVDDRVALLESRPGQGCEEALVVRHEGAVRALSTLFEQAWTCAQDLSSQRRPCPAGPTRPLARAGELGREHGALLRLYADGATDEAAGRALGLSPRTVRRLTATLCEQMGARSRFELGVAAARGGWV